MFTIDNLLSIFYPCGASGTKGLIINDSGGVSNAEESEIVLVSPIKKTDDVDTETK